MQDNKFSYNHMLLRKIRLIVYFVKNVNLQLYLLNKYDFKNLLKFNVFSFILKYVLTIYKYENSLYLTFQALEFT